jgi:hypothetical protein
MATGAAGNLFSADAACISVSVTNAASASTALPGTGSVLRMVNEGPNHCYIHVTSGTAAATVPTGAAARTATPVLAGSDVSLTIPATGTALNISAICAGVGTATLRVQVGEGM